MSRDAHPQAMAPSRPGRTRTAPPQLPDRYPFAGRYLRYMLFDLTGIVYLLLGLLALCATWSLGSGEAEWNRVLASYRSGPYVAFHALALVAVIFVGVRFFALFPKSQPPRIGPAKPPPAPVILALLYGLWIGVTGALAAVLAGWVLP